MHPAHTALTTNSKFVRSKLESHIADWEHCNRCPLFETARWVVIGRGSLPCDVLFIGEAPGNSENDIGKPFIGRSGRLLDRMIADTVHNLRKAHRIRWEYTYAITNLIGCIPPLRNDAGQIVTTSTGYKFRLPSPLEVRECQPRMQYFAQLASPRAIVLLGDPAWRQAPKPLSLVFPKERMPPIHQMYHPSYILRVGGLSSKAYKSWTTGLTVFLRDLYKAKPQVTNAQSQNQSQVQTDLRQSPSDQD